MIRPEGEPRRLRPTKRTVLAAGLTGIVLGVSGTLGVQAINQSDEVKPGGVWISPNNGERVPRTIHFDAQAYPTDPKDPPIAYINFTAKVDGTWRTVCRVTPPPPTAIPDFTCEWSVPKNVTSNETIIVSFDVYDTKGNVNKAPNGEHTITVIG